jgi:hypothetical protein
MTTLRVAHQHRAGLTRREVQVGYSGLFGLGLSSLLAGRGEAEPAAERVAAQRAKSVIFAGAGRGRSSRRSASTRAASLRDRVNRPLHANEGRVIETLLGGAAS